MALKAEELTLIFQDPVSGENLFILGNGYLAGIELNDDMISTKPETLTIMTLTEPFGRSSCTIQKWSLLYNLERK